jgi:CHAD domain-containing protein
VEPDLPLAEAVRLTLATGIAAMMYHEAAAIAGEIEPLHQMRVATRRLRAIVQLFAGAIHGSRIRIYRRDLPWLGQAAGAVRECDVIEALIRECGGRLDPALAGALTPLCDALAADRNSAHSRFVAELHTKRYARMCELIANPLLRRVLPSTDAVCNAPAMIAPIANSVRKAGKRMSRDAPPEVFHRLRVRIKRLRYGFEMLSGMGGKRARKALIRLEQMQELLGLHQDAVVTMAWLRGYAGVTVGAPPETLMAAGAMLQALIVQREKLATRACRLWRKIERSNVIDDALSEIASAAEQRLESARQTLAAAAASEQIDAGPGAPVVAIDDPMTADVAAEVGESAAQYPLPGELSPPMGAMEPPQEPILIQPPPEEGVSSPEEAAPYAQASPPLANEQPLAETATPGPVAPAPQPSAADTAATPEADDLPPATTSIPNNG